MRFALGFSIRILHQTTISLASSTRKALAPGFFALPIGKLGSVHDTGVYGFTESLALGRPSWFLS